MPRMIKLAEYGDIHSYDNPYSADDRASLFECPVATEEELLDFANMVRKAGGAEAISELLLAVKSASDSCLIANALNFSSTVDIVHPTVSSSTFASGIVTEFKDTFVSYISAVWAMYVRSEELALKIAAEIGTSVVLEKYVLLPEEIGNAAHAFDHGQAFKEFSL